MYISDEEAFGFRAAAERQRRVIVAIILRNIRTRFFGHGLGFLVAIAWPLLHSLFIIGLFVFAGRAPPFGESLVLFVATGSVQFQAFSYMSRFAMMSMLSTKPLLAFPAVKLLDVLFASIILEIVSSAVVIILMIALGWAFDVPMWPRDIVEAAAAYACVTLLGVGFGLLNGVIALAAPMWAMLYTLVIILLYATSSTIFVPTALAEPLQTFASYHPVLQMIEWMRYAYYEGYSDHVLDRTYAVGVSLVSVFLGLALERGMRGWLLASR